MDEEGEEDGKFRFESLRILAASGDTRRISSPSARTVFESLTSRNEDLDPPPLPPLVATMFEVISGKDAGTKEGRLRRFPLIEAVARA